MKKTTGAHYTPATLARFVAEKILSGMENFEHKTLRILDPAVGDGELLEALAHALLPVLPKGCKVEMHGFDTSQIAIENARQRLVVIPEQRGDVPPHLRFIFNH